MNKHFIQLFLVLGFIVSFSANANYIPLKIGSSTIFIPLTPAEPPPGPPVFPTTDLIAEYLFDDANNLGLDTSGNNHNGTLRGTFTTNIGLAGTAAVFSRAQYIEIPDSDAFSVGANGLTISFWLKQEQVNDWKGIISKSNQSSSEWFVDNAYDRKVGELHAGITASNNQIILSNKSTTEKNVWDHYAIVISGTSSSDTIKLYKNGVKETEATTSSAHAYSNTTAPMTIGRSFNQLASKYHFYSGLMDNLRLYSRAVSVEEVFGLHQELTPPAAPTSTLIAIDDYYTVGRPATNYLPIFSYKNDISSDPGSLKITSVGAANNGETIVYVGDFAVRYLPNNGFCGYDSFDYTITDSTNATSTATIHVSVECEIVNSRPTGIQDSVTLDRNSSVTAEVLSNDWETDLHDLDAIIAIEKVAGQGKGTVTVNPDDTVTYVPDHDFCGTDTYYLRMRDIYALDDYTEIVFNVNCTNRKPIATHDNISTNKATPVTFFPHANDSDPDGDAILTAAVFAPQHGTTQLNTDRSVTYTPNPNHCGTDGFSYDVEDTGGLFWWGWVYVNVNCPTVNDPPVLTADTATTNKNSDVDIDVLSNDTDPQGDALTVVSTSTASNGTVSINANQTIQYTPTIDYCGIDSFTYSVQDTAGNTSSTGVNITIDCTIPSTITATTLEWSPAAVVIGQQSTLRWAFTGATSCTSTHSNKTTVSGEEVLSFMHPSTVIATFTCIDASNVEHDFSQTLEVSKLAAPTNLRHSNIQ